MLRGLWTTLRAFFSRPITISYPEEKRPVRNRFKGRHYLTRYDNGLEKCIGCAQCIAMCPESALKIFWESDKTVFQEKLVETAAAVWQKIQGKTIVINALLNITVECDCLPGKNPIIGEDYGFIGGYHPVEVDSESLKMTGPNIFEKVHPGTPWRRQFSYAREIGFTAKA